MHENQDLNQDQDFIKDRYNFEPECALPGTALTCLNALKHGGRARTLFIPGEQPQDFFNMLAEDFATHKPITIQDSALVADATVARWMLWRRQRSYSKSEFEKYNDNDQEDTLNPNDLRDLEQFDRYRIQAERSLGRALTALRHVKKDQFNSEKWHAQHEMQQKRFDLDVQRFELRKEQAALKAKQAEAKANEFKTDDFVHHIGLKDQIPVIEQTAYVSHINGVTQLALEPSNEVVQRIIENRKRFTIMAPIYVSRKFFFHAGTVPKEYEWLKQKLPAEAFVGLDKVGKGIHLQIPFEGWRVFHAGESAIQRQAQERRQEQQAA